MVKSPIQIILEIITYIIQNTIETLLIIIKKLGELFVSLTFIAGAGMVGLIIALIIGGIVLFFISKYLFGTTTSLIKVFLIYIIIVIVLILVLSFV